MRLGLAGRCRRTHPAHVPQYVLAASDPPFVGGGLAHTGPGAGAPTHARSTSGRNMATLAIEVGPEGIER